MGKPYVSTPLQSPEDKPRSLAPARKNAAEATGANLRIMLVDDDDARAAFVTQALHAGGHDVVARLSASEDLVAAVRRVHPDVILVDMDNPARDVLDNCAAVTQTLPRPIVFFARSSDQDTIDQAIRAGVSAYIVDGLNEHRLKPILDVAIARFREHQRLHEELRGMRTRLADRRDVERAKAILGRLRHLDEEAAYALLRSNAMARRVTIGEAARAVIAAADMLGDDSKPAVS